LVLKDIHSDEVLRTTALLGLGRASACPGMAGFRLGTYFFACRNALIEEREGTGSANLRQSPGKSAIEMDERFPETETYFEGIHGH